jgi:hypothetical protein
MGAACAVAKLTAGGSLHPSERIVPEFALRPQLSVDGRGVWPSCVYGLPVCMASLCIWPACVYGLPVVYWCACLFTGVVYGLTGVVYGLSAQHVSPPSRHGAASGRSLRARQAPAPRARAGKSSNDAGGTGDHPA